MTNKEAFILEIEKITENFEEPVPLQEILSEQAYDFFISLKESKNTNEEITEKGAFILKYMQKENEKNVTNFIKFLRKLPYVQDFIFIDEEIN